jgi:hypothetical protein
MQASSPKSPIITPPERKPKGRNGMYCIYTCLDGRETSPSYSTAAAPVSNASDIIPTDTSVADDGRHSCTALDETGSVVPNCAVGFGPPLTVIVAWDGKGLAVALPESTMENFCELAYRPPWVLFTNRMK